MLKKLLKQDFIAIARYAIPLFLAMIVLTTLTCLLGLIEFTHPLLKLIPGFSMVIYVITMFCGVFGVFILTIGRFYKSMVTSEAYLTYTLPCKVSELISSKLIVSFCVMIVNYLVIALSVQFVVLVYADRNLAAAITEGIGQMFPDTQKWVVILFSILFLLITTVWQQIAYYLAISLGQVLCKNKIVGSVVAYIIISSVIQVVLFVIFFIIGLIAGLSNIELYMNTGKGMGLIFGIEGLLIGVLSVIGCFMMNHFLSKRLNLE